MARRDGKKVRLISRNGKDLTYRFPLVVQAVAALPVHSCVIDGEAIVSDANGLAVFNLIRSYRNGPRATICAFDLIEIDGEDLRWKPIEDRRLPSRAYLADRILALHSTSTSTSRARSYSIMPASSAARASYRSTSARHTGSADQAIGLRSRTRLRQR